jgi:hypothetical protein
MSASDGVRPGQAQEIEHSELKASELVWNFDDHFASWLQDAVYYFKTAQRIAKMFKYVTEMNNVEGTRGKICCLKSSMSNVDPVPSAGAVSRILRSLQTNNLPTSLPDKIQEGTVTRPDLQQGPNTLLTLDIHQASSIPSWWQLGFRGKENLLISVRAEVFLFVEAI